MPAGAGTALSKAVTNAFIREFPSNVDASL
jgi:hypothetical protein